MKLRNILLALLLPFAAFAENVTRPTSFVGVPWGSTPEDTVRILGARAGVSPPEEGTVVGDKLELTGGKFAGQNVTKWTIEFTGRKLYAATVLLKADAGASSLYRELKQMLTAKYGAVSGEIGRASCRERVYHPV